MSYNTPEQLRTYMNLTEAQLSDEIAQSYLDAAYIITTDYLGEASLGTDRLTLIELNLAAHFAFIGPSGGITSSGMLSKIKVGQSEETYKVLSDSMYGVATSQYGQIAMMLDPTGKLAGLSAPPLRALFEVVSSDYRD